MFAYIAEIVVCNDMRMLLSRKVGLLSTAQNKSNRIICGINRCDHQGRDHYERHYHAETLNSFLVNKFRVDSSKRADTVYTILLVADDGNTSTRKANEAVLR